MKFLLVFLCIAIIQFCWSSPLEAFSLRSTNTADCVNEKIKNARQVKKSDAALIVSILCAADEHHQKGFDHDAKNTIKTGLSADCIEEKLKSISNHFSILKDLNPSKTEAQCES